MPGSIGVLRGKNSLGDDDVEDPGAPLPSITIRGTKRAGRATLRAAFVAPRRGREASRTGVIRAGVLAAPVLSRRANIMGVSVSETTATGRET